MGLDIVVIGVGKIPTHFALHKNLVVRTGEKIAALINQPLEPGKITVLSAEDPAVFKLFIDYMYSRKVPAVTPAMHRAVQGARTSHLCQLYCFLAKFDANADIRNQTIDRIQDAFALMDALPEPRLIPLIYQHTATDSPLRQLCVTSMLYYLNSQKYISNAVVVELMQDRQFASDFLNAVRLSKIENRNMAADPRIRHCGQDEKCAECAGDFSKLKGKEGTPPCYFHVHPQVKDGAGVKYPSCYLWKA